MKKKWKSKAFWRTRNLIFLMLFSISGFCANVSFSQVAEERFTLEEGSIESIFRQIREQSDYEFFYNTSVLDVKQKVHLTSATGSIDDILKQVLGDHYSYRIQDNYIMIYKSQQSQQVKSVLVQGTVLDHNRQPLPGVTIRIEGTNHGTVSDSRGIFKISLPASGGKLNFSFIGCNSKIITIAAGQTKQELRVILEEDVQAMDEVVVTGYGNVSRGSYTGATNTVKAGEILVPGATSIEQMLQGVVPGMLVMNTTGQVGATAKVRVRGTSTLLGNQEPVWVVDGVIQRDPLPFNSEDNLKFSVDADDIKQLAGNAISWLNPNDIESITVLKDASATAIYGSKAANGVIVITTKKANIGKISVNYSGDFSIGQRPHYGLYDMMNSAERMQFSKDIYAEKRKFPAGTSLLPIGYEGLVEKMLNKEITQEQMDREYRKMAMQNTDWFGELFRNSFSHSHTLGISGGSRLIQNRTSFGFSQQDGESRGNGMTSFTATSNTTVNIKDRLRISMSLRGTVREAKGYAYGVDPFSYAYNTSRVIPAYNEDGSYFFHEKYGKISYVNGEKIYNFNIMNEMNNTGSESTTRSWGSTIDLKWDIIPGLQYQGLVSYNSSSSDTKKYATEHSFYITQCRGYEYGSVLGNSEEEKSSPLPMGGVLGTSLTNLTSISVRNSLVYNRTFKEKHRMTLQVGLETNSVKSEGEVNERYGYMPDRGETFVEVPFTFINKMQGGNHTENEEYKQGAVTVLNRVSNELSGYASAIYTYNDRYVFNFSSRVDASNRFGQDKNKRFQPTWSTGLKWRMARENFLSELSWLNTLDLYGSYGFQGNAVTTVAPDLLAKNKFIHEINNFGLEITSLPYPDLGWEKTKTYNLGLDASFLKGRMNFNFNYFKKISHVLSSRNIPFENGTGNGVVSGTTMENKGYDFIINVVPVVTRDFKWQLSLNTAITRNHVDKNKRINTLNDFLRGGAIVEGVPYSTFYSYAFDGLEQQFGQPKFKNLDVESGDTPLAYLVKTGKFTPDFSGGLNTMFKYKQLSLYALFSVQWGGYRRLPDFYPVSNGYKGLPGPASNASRRLLNRWKKPGDLTDVPSLPGSGFEMVYLPATRTQARVQKNRYELYNFSDARVAKSDFIRCRSIALTYDFNGDWMQKSGIKNFKVKASMTNPFMWSADDKWDGLDPETGNWPARRVTSLSLQLMF